MAFETKDSGERASFASGMVRDTQTGKPRYGLIPRGPLKRTAALYARGAEKYDARNWEKADSVDELERFGESAFRHLMQLLDGETDEDHGAAVVFNVWAFMWLEEKLAAANPPFPRVMTKAEIAEARDAWDAAFPRVMTKAEIRAVSDAWDAWDSAHGRASVPDVAGRDA